MSVILIVGIPHGGTTILRKIIGNIDGVLDCTEEIDAIMGIDVERLLAKGSGKDIVVKSPFTPLNIREYNHPKLKIIYIIKNPYDVYGSYAVRFGSEEHYTRHYIDRYGLGKYAQLAKLWLELRSSNIFTLKYEELFSNEYSKLKELVVWLGYTWNDSIVTSSRIAGHQYIKPGDKVEMVNTGANNAPYRYYQINQEFRDMTGESSKNIYPNTKKILDSMQVVKDLDYLKYSP